MRTIDRGKQQFFFLIAAIAAFVFVTNIVLLSGVDVRTRIKNIPIPIPGKGKDGNSAAPDPNARISFYIYSAIHTDFLYSFLSSIHGITTMENSRIMRRWMTSIPSGIT